VGRSTVAVPLSAEAGRRPVPGFHPADHCSSSPCCRFRAGLNRRLSTLRRHSKHHDHWEDNPCLAVEFLLCSHDFTHPRRRHTMTAIQVQGPTLALDPATRSTLLQTIVDCLPQIPNASAAERTAQREAAFALVGELCPTGPVEAMLAAEAIAAHCAGIHAFRCAARPDLPYDLQLRYQASARSL